MTLTVAIPTRLANTNETLRYAARAWTAAVPDVQLVTVGHRVPWWAGQHLPTRQTTNGQWTVNFPAALRACVAELDAFVWAADDIFPLRTTSVPTGDPHNWPTWCRDLPLDEYVTRWLKTPTQGYTLSFVYGMSGQLDIIREVRPDLERIPNADLHMPHMLQADRVDELLTLFRSDYPHHPAGHFRAVYGALWPGELVTVRDPKVGRGHEPVRTALGWASTCVASWSGVAGRQIRMMFPRPSRYER